MLRQTRLWDAKSIFWQVAEQYHTILQREHRINDGDGDDAVANSVFLRSVPLELQNGCSGN